MRARALRGGESLLDRSLLREADPLRRIPRGRFTASAQRFLVCEGPSDPSGYSAACGSAFAFNHTATLIAAAKGDPAAVQRVADFHQNAPAGISTMLSNHDSFAGARAFTQFQGNLAQYKLAAATYLLQPGTPFIYYGEEVGMANGTQDGDAALRTPMSWTADQDRAGFTTGTPYRTPSSNVASFNADAQASDAGSLLAHYRALLALRNGFPSVTAGSYENVAVAGSLMSFLRRLGNERTVVVLNYGTAAASASLANLPPGALLANAFPSGAADASVDANGAASVAMGAQALRVFSVR